MLLGFLLIVPGFASDGTVQTDGSTACSTANGHPETGGYYIVGFGYQDVKASEDPNDPSTYPMQKADDYTWKIPGEGDTPYPDAQPLLCTSYYGCASDYNILYHHTCSILRFAWEADVDSSVYKMTNNDTFQACDFTAAELIEEMDDLLPGGQKYAEFPFEQDAIDQIHYFASQNGCAEGQKVAVLIGAGYSDTYDSCYAMGTETSRIQHCDCGHTINTYTMAEVCGAGLHDGCMSEMPDDLSCCPGNDVTYASYTYTNGGNCIPKSKMHEMMESAKITHAMCNDEANTAECDAYLTGDCPWWRVYSHGGWTYNTLVDGICADGTEEEDLVDGKCADGESPPHCPSTQLRYGGRGAKVEDIPENYGCDGSASEYTPTCDMWYMKNHCEALEAASWDVSSGDFPEEITESSCGNSQQWAAYKKYDATPADWDLWLETGSFTTAAPTPAPTTAAPTTEAVEQAFATYAAIGLIFAVIS